MRTLLLLTFCITLFSCGTNRAIYKSSDFDQKAFRLHTIAILPVQITQTGYVGKHDNEEAVKAANEKWSTVFQESLHSCILLRTSKKRNGLIVNFQGVQQTNALLKEAGISLQDLPAKKPEDLARLLGVDAVLITTLEKDKNMSDGVAYGLAAGRTVLTILGRASTGSMLSMNASDVYLHSSLYYADDSQLLWKTYRRGGTNLPSHVDDLVQYYSEWIARKFPYRS